MILVRIHFGRRLESAGGACVLGRLARSRRLPPPAITLLQIHTKLIGIVRSRWMLNLMLSQGAEMRLLVYLCHHLIVCRLRAIVVQLSIAVLE